MPGGWSFNIEITPYDYAVFYSAVNDLQENFYYPVAVATQVVNGMNYKFIAIEYPKNPQDSERFVIVYIYQPIDGKPYVKEIVPI